MRIHILCITKRPRGWVTDASEEYLKRLRGQIDIVVHDISPQKRASKTAQLEKEADRLSHLVPERACMVALDERGDMWSTEQLSKKLDTWRHEYADVACIIGGAEGLAPGILSGADHRWSLSRLTLPHQLARVILAEQLYRGWSLLHNHPYHKC
jgi:23S rRNA (pseudouridine1915-N3)-methyltransferase